MTAATLAVLEEAIRAGDHATALDLVANLRQAVDLSEPSQWTDAGRQAKLDRVRYAVVVEREEDGGYSVWVPELPGCASQGDTRDEALANIREAIACYLEALAKLGEAPPRHLGEVEVVSVEAA